MSHVDARQQTSERILKAVKKKSLKGYEANTVLIVEFESLHVESQADREALDKFAKDRLLPLAQRFQGLYLVSDTGAVSLSYDLAAT